jgi:regulatory protein
VDPQELCVALAEHEPRLARERALQLLGYRERSRTELLERLLVNGFPREVAESVVERFCEVELVDDSRFASAWIRTRVSAGYGRRRIARELAEKGVDDHLIQSALDDEIHGDEAYRARDSLRGRRPRDAKDRERLIRRLVSRGFELRVALEAVDTVEQD